MSIRKTDERGSSRADVRRADEKLVEQIADTPAPFWRHVRDVLAERHP